MKTTSLLALTLLVSTPTLPGDDEGLEKVIDSRIAARSEGALSPVCDDTEFVRRVFLDLAGRIPTVDETRKFFSDTSRTKRVTLIDKLLRSDEFASSWVDSLSVQLLRRQTLGKIKPEDWRTYLFNSLRKKPRWDEMVRAMVSASGTGEDRAAMKFLGSGNHHQMTEDIARLFLGMDLECARCHDHPSINTWSQADYWGLYTYLSWTRPATNTLDKNEYFVEVLGKTEIEYQSVFESVSDLTGPRLPGMTEKAMPVLAKGEEFSRPAENGLPPVPRFLPRQELSRDLTSPEYLPFARNSVNRFWARLLGRGLVHPLDQVHADNPPSHPGLLDTLASKFVAQKYDLKWLIRSIMLSDTYQRSSRLPPGSSSVAPKSYRAAIPKPLSPEQLLTSVLLATGNHDRVLAQKVPSGTKFDRKGYFTGTNKTLPGSYDEIQAIFIQTFGQPPGEPETDFTPGLNQSLFLMNDKLLLTWLKPASGNLVQRLASLGDPAAIAEELYLGVLSRQPVESEIEEVSGHLEKNKDRREVAIGELAWALINSTEFRLNH